MPEAELLTAASAGEAAERIREAQRDRASLLACGRRTRLARHAPAAAPDRWLSLSAMDRLLEFDAEDQTCVVEPGLAPEALDQAAAEHGLELGVLAPAGGSLGGLFLSPDLSLLSGYFGPPRDQVLGADWLLADGTAVRTGARVVKSVAGYDLTRLFLGSRGRLAVCTRLVLRLRPRPRRPSWCLGDPASARELPAPRLLFQLSPGEPAFALLEGIEEPGCAGWQAVDAARGEAALRDALACFTSASHRLAFPAGGPLPDGLDGAIDLLGGQAAVRASLPPRVAADRRYRLLPAAAPSSWLARIQQACAAGCLPFGGRPA